MSKSDEIGFTIILICIVILIGMAGATIQEFWLDTNNENEAICKALDAKPEGNVCIKDNRVVYRIP